MQAPWPSGRRKARAGDMRDCGAAVGGADWNQVDRREFGRHESNDIDERLGSEGLME
jgi:hypothetical protein